MNRTFQIHPDTDELAGILRETWPALSARARLEGPVNDGEPAGGGSGGEGGGGSGGEGGQSGSGESGSGEGDPAGGSGSGSGGSGGAGDGTVSIPRSEWDNLQRQNRESREQLKKLQEAEAERQRKADEEAGNHRAIAEREQKRAEEAERKAAEREQELQTERRTNRGHRIATNLRFHDPSEAIALLRDAGQAESLDADESAEKALKALAEKKPHLVRDADKSRQRDLGNGDGGGKTGDDPELSGTSRLAAAYGSSKT